MTKCIFHAIKKNRLFGSVVVANAIERNLSQSIFISVVSEHFIDIHRRIEAVTLPASVVEKLLFIKGLPVRAAQSRPVLLPNLWIYPLNLSVMLFTSHIDTLITQFSHATHTHHSTKHCNSLQKTAFLVEKNFKSKWRINSTVKLY